MLLYVEDCAHTPESDFPTDTIKIMLDHEVFYPGTDYAYRFTIDGTVAAMRLPVGLNEGSIALRRYNLLHFFGNLFPQLEQPPTALRQLAMNIASSHLIESDRDKTSWPIQFPSNTTLEVHKKASASLEDTEDQLLQLIADHFHIPLHGLVTLYY